MNKKNLYDFGTKYERQKLIVEGEAFLKIRVGPYDRL